MRVLTISTVAPLAASPASAAPGRGDRTEPEQSTGPISRYQPSEAGAELVRPSDSTLPGNYDRNGQVRSAEGAGTASAEPVNAKATNAEPPGEAKGSPTELDPEERAIVAELKARDAEVRAHEHAHMGAGGALAGGASYSYQNGPDGKRYAVGGEVPISLPSSDNPATTIRNAQQVRRAALAPAKPSGADQGIAAMATGVEAQARSELRVQEAEQAEAQTDAKDDEEVELI